MNVDQLLKKFQSKKTELEKKVQEKSKLEGKKEQIFSQLKEKFNCSSIKEAEQLMKKLEDEKRKESDILEQEVKEWENEYDRVKK